MKVLTISHSSVVGSYQGKLHQLSRYPNVTLSLIVPPSWKEGGRAVAATTGRYSSFQTHVVPAYRLNRIASYFYNPLVLRKTVLAISPTIIYVEEEPWSIAAWQSIQIARTINAKVVFFTWENIWKRYKRLSERILDYVLAHAAGAVAGTIEAESILKRRGFTKPVMVFPQHGVDLELFKNKTEPSSLLLSLPKPIVAYAGRLEFEKGVHLLLEAISKVSGEWSLLVLGNGSAKEQLVLLSEKLNIRRRVTFIDAVPHEDIPRYLRHVDILVIPSLTTATWKEQFGRILVEAMSCGIAVIGSNSGAIPEVIGDAGVVFREGNSDDLAERISMLLNNSSLQAEYGLRGRRRVEIFYSDDSIAERLYDYFSSIMYRS